MGQKLLILLAVATLTACQTVPDNPNESPLDASQGVKDLFEQNADAEQATQEIHCEKRKKLGTRMSKRVCRTKTEIGDKRAPKVLRAWSDVSPALKSG